MKEEYSALFTPWKIGNLQIRNRIVLLPMGSTSLLGTAATHFDANSGQFFMECAKNGAGLVIPGIQPVWDFIGGQWIYKNPVVFCQLKKYMKEFHKTGAKLFVQLTAGFGRSLMVPTELMGLYNNQKFLKALKPVVDFSRMGAAPSKLPNRWADNCPSRPMEKSEILDMIDAFGKTAKKLRAAGVDGVEIHAVHEGYLLDQFTLKYCNHRTDEYGGSFENRYRFAAEIVQSIKRQAGSDYPVSLRYSVESKTKGFRVGALPGETGYTEIGRDMAESEKAAKFLQDAGYDMLNSDNGTYDAWYWSHPPMYMPLNCNLADVSHIKKFVDIPVTCGGRMEPKDAAEAIRKGDIDAMGVARQFLADPEWIRKLQEDDEADILPCICCHNACMPFGKFEGSGCAVNYKTMTGAKCAVNPITRQYKKYKIEKAETPKNVAVIGGGIGGMAAARVLTLRGHKVTLYEKSDRLGGVFIAAAAPDFKEKDKELIEWYRRQMDQLHMDIRFNTEVKDVKALGADAVIVATGAVANKIPVKGAEKAIDAVDYLLGEEVGQNVVIIGGGLTGCEIAYDLYRKGKNPAIVEMMNDLIAVPGINMANTTYLRDFFKLKKVPVYLRSKLGAIGDGEVTVLDKDGNPFTVKADSVILSVGYKPTPVAKADKKNQIYVIGDAASIGNLKKAIWSAWDAAMTI